MVVSFFYIIFVSRKETLTKLVMTQEEKKLILKDLGGRLAFGVKCYIPEVDTTSILSAIQEDGENTLYDFWEDDRKIRYGYQLYTSEFKPYLFPLDKISGDMWSEYLTTCVGGNASFPTLKSFEWFNENHIDFRGLIPKGLALDATGLNIY